MELPNTMGEKIWWRWLKNLSDLWEKLVQKSKWSLGKTVEGKLIWLQEKTRAPIKCGLEKSSINIGTCLLGNSQWLEWTILDELLEAIASPTNWRQPNLLWKSHRRCNLPQGDRTMVEHLQQSSLAQLENDFPWSLHGNKLCLVALETNEKSKENVYRHKPRHS